MKIVLIAALVLPTLAVPAVAQKTVAVRGYVRSDGTYVQPSTRTAPNSTKTDNWSSAPNVNPYTGKAGTVDPYAPPKVPAYTPYQPYKAK
jgi:hypothetical protein